MALVAGRVPHLLELIIGENTLPFVRGRNLWAFERKCGMYRRLYAPSNEDASDSKLMGLFPFWK